ncbi:MAG: isochorismate synthase [Bacteroidetes bacterium]|nr:isochorismate synthase [Bacteroidota bacterium]
MKTLSDLNNWISTGRDFLWLRTPGQTQVLCLGIGEPTNQLTNSAVVICPFSANTPFVYPIQHQLTVDVDALASISIQLPARTSLEGTSTQQQQYIEQVEKALDAIKLGELTKVVVAQTQWLDKKVNPIAAFQKACESQDAYTYLAYVKGECWIGSSPELFLKSDYTTSETVALAGTRLSTNKNKAWGEKEIQEQSIVATYLTNTFKDLKFKDVSLGASFTKTVGHIQHICNTVTAKNPYDLDLLGLLTALHPTPALAGFPKNAAKSFIAQTEQFSRNLYGGFIGYKDETGMEYFVNIRCARLFNDSAQLYAGAGINRDSNPQSEWEETNNKLEVIRSILG